MKAIPTLYNGIQFRSRLEATWAAFFDAMEWQWEYEPCVFDGPGWTPDFLLPEHRILVEVKPQSNVARWADDEAIEYAKRRPIDTEDLLLFVGVSPVSMDLLILPPQAGEPSFEDKFPDGYVSALMLGIAVFGCNKAEICPAVATIQVWQENGEIMDRWSVLPTFAAEPVCEAHEALFVSVAAEHFKSKWAEAKNAVQWRPPGGMA